MLLDPLLGMGWTEVYLAGVASGKITVWQEELKKNGIALFDRIKLYKEWIKCVCFKKKICLNPPKVFWQKKNDKGRNTNSGGQLKFLSFMSICTSLMNTLLLL